MMPNYTFSFFIIISLVCLIVLSSIDVVFADQEFLVASWNLKDFWGYPSYGNDDPVNLDKIREFALVLTRSNYEQFDKNYDIIFVQELKWDKDTNSFDAFEILCDDYLYDLNYNCSSVTGGTFNGEGYGVIYRDGIDVEVYFTGDPSVTPYWEQQPVRPKIDRVPEALSRPPMMVKVSVDSGIFEFIVFNNHIKPSDKISKIPDDHQQKFRDEFGSYIHGRTQEYIAFTEQELEIIFQKIKQTEFDTENIMVLGDLNADCAYLENDLGSYDFIEDGWTILGSGNVMTNFAKNECWYDRIIISNEMKPYFSEIGEPVGMYPSPRDTQEFRFIDSEEGLSDHKLIWAEFIIYDALIEHPSEIILTDTEYKNLGLYGTISVVIGGILYEIRIKRNT